MSRPLNGVTVLDFSTLLPGPLATLVLAEAGAEVIKVERPPHGDEMRRDPAEFALLNRGKRSVALDLKDPASSARLTPLIERADVLVEQFRPGVMERLGLGWDEVRAINPRIVYCSITGYGADGPKAHRAGHDLTYAAEAGLLARTAGGDGAPGMPQALVGDVGAGSYPAVINILMALLRRERTGEGARIEVAMFDNLFPFLSADFARGFGRGEWPEPGASLETGGSPRYNLYRTADGRFLAAAPAEPKFWTAFCDAIGLPEDMRSDDDWPATRAAVADRIAARTAADWREVFAGVDTPVSVVASFEEALRDPQIAARGLLDHRVAAPGLEIPALPVPVSAAFRDAPGTRSAPALGEDQELLGS